MNDKDYVAAVLRTESVDFEAIKSRLSDERTIRILHAAIGLVTESGEITDALKKHIFYGKPLDIVNLFEEHGDLFWYMGVLADAGGFSFENSKATNIAKLRARYPDKFKELDALSRNLDNERKTLEGMFGS